MFTHRTASAVFALLIVATVLAGTGCAHAYVVHPNAVSKTDSQIFDVMRDTQQAIEDAKKIRDQIPGLRAALHDKIIPAYNAAEAAYIAYHKALDAGAKPDQQKEVALAAQMLAVKNSIAPALAGGR